MSRTVVQVEKLGKRYRIGQAKQHNALSHLIGDALRAPVRLVRGSNDTSSAQGNDGPSNARNAAAGASANRNTNGNSPYIWALKDVSFEVKEGEVVGLIGRNGAGKSTLLKILARVTRPTEGNAEIHGRVGSLLEVGTGFHPELTGRENVFMSGAILGMRAEEIRRKFDEIVAFSEVERFLDTPLKHFSSGMQVRLAFAVAAHLEPEILLVDEVLAVGDLEFQKKCLGKMSDVARAGRTIVLVSHQLNQIRRLCHRVVWIDDGQVRKDGNTHEVVSAYESAMARRDSNRAPNRRRANFKGRFLRWKITDPPGSDSHILTEIGPVTIRFIVEINEHLRKAVHGIALFNHDRQLIWGWATAEMELIPGEQEFCYTFPMLPVRPGPYDWLVSLYNDREEIDVWDCLPEMVVATDDHQHQFDNWHGLLNIPSEFSVLGSVGRLK
jgi:lipopolysaccharide transport system ATP-binding protein